MDIIANTPYGCSMGSASWATGAWKTGAFHPINRVYQELWGPLHNFFLPSMKLIEKQRVGSRWRRKHDQPQTAYRRLLKWGVLSAKNKRQLREQYHSIDPFEFHEQLERSLRPILAKALEANEKT